MLVPKGSYEILCVLINSETVVNDDGVRELEINDGEWIIQPSGQRFEIEQIKGGRALLRSSGHRYFAEVELTGAGSIQIDLKRENVSETISVEATLVESALPVDHAVSPSW